MKYCTGRLEDYFKTPKELQLLYLTFITVAETP